MGLFSWLFGTREKTPSSVVTKRRKPAGAVTNYRKPASAKVKWRDGSYPLDAVGESNYQDALISICGGYNRHGQDLETWAEIEREPGNPYDSNAVTVTIDGRTIGYLSRDQAKRVSSQMLQDGVDRARCKAKIVGGWRTNQHDSGHFGVRLGIPTRDWIDFGVGKQPPAKEQKQPRAKSSRPKAASTGPLVGQWVVVWGAPKYGDVAQELAALGANIMADVGKSTTMVVHIDDVLTPGAMSSSKYTKAQAHIDQGSKIEIVSLRKLRDRLKAN